MSFNFTFKDPSPEIKSHFTSTPWCATLFTDPTLRPFTTREPQETTFDSFMGKTLSTNETIIAWQSFLKTGTSHTENLALLSLGSGINGHVDTSHGGFLGVVLDEVLGNAAEIERPKGKATMTAYLKVDYKRPVRTPSVVLVRGWVERVEGRKMWVGGAIEDGMGVVFATGEGLFIVVEPVKPLERL